MKIKNYWFVFGAIFVFVVLVLCVFSQTQESATQAKAEILKKSIPEEWLRKSPCSMEHLADAIVSDNEELAASFEKGDFGAMAKLYVARGGAIISPEYKIYSCREDIAEFWKGVWVKGAELKFTTVHVYLSDLLGKQPGYVFRAGNRVETKFDTIAFVINTFSIASKKSGASAYDPGDTRVYCHQEECTWKDGRDGGR
jgi:hypothetical protein